MAEHRTIPCAIYTRKSTEEGLEQAFNSLDAQYEACKAYIESQKHEGWKLLARRYDDGGISGATLERPGLAQLIDDMEHGLVGMIVVYKIDRLTRSLADFARLVERMDQAGCSFVSVTQAFNTSNSMGRLTLNVLLSFAQFEREVTAERIRDKIAASKAKGMWMGGYPPLGYDRHPDPNIQSLVINPKEARQIETLFDLFEQHGRLADVEREARNLAIRSKLHVFAKGNSPSRTRGGSLMSRGQIHALLSNPVHAGMIRHKDKVHEGMHPAIIERDRWHRVQLALARNARKSRRIPAIGGSDPNEMQGQKFSPAPNTLPPVPLLRGLLFDEDGNRLTPTHSSKQNTRDKDQSPGRKNAAGKRRYRYYVSTFRPEASSSIPAIRLPAEPVERIVVTGIINYLTQSDAVTELLAEPDIESISLLKAASAKLAKAIEGQPDTLRELLARVILGEGSLTVHLDPEALARGLAIEPELLVHQMLKITLPFTRRKRGNEMKLIAASCSAAPDPVLVKTLARSHRWLKMLQEGKSLDEIARLERHSASYIRTRLPMALLSPKIQAAILDGRQPAYLTADAIARQTLPIDWCEQALQLGFDT